MTSLILATRNRHKTREFAALLGGEFSVRDLTSVSEIPAIAETGRTFAENATLKATAVSNLVRDLVVADDSGLEVDSLGGAPGVYSARYAGANASDEANVAKLLSAVGQERAARFRCFVALAKDGRVLALFEGSVQGRIASAPSGELGFGYDPVFVPDGYGATFADLGDAVKNQISHRARAVAQLCDYLNQKEALVIRRRPT